MHRDVFRLFPGWFSASGRRTDRGGVFRERRGAEADDGQRLGGTCDFRWTHPRLRSLQDVLALSLLKKRNVEKRTIRLMY